MQKKDQSTKTLEQEIVVTRTFDAPREKVWKAWTEPEQVKQWWGPKGFTAPVVKIDFRVGGEYLFDMRSPDGKDFWSKGTYKEIAAPSRIVATDSFADEKGNTVPATYYGMSSKFALESLVTVTFEEIEGGKTKLTLRYPGVPSENYDSALTGWNQTLDKLAEYLKAGKRTNITAEPGKLDYTITRVFDAPREQVFKAFIDPQLYTQWLGLSRLKMTLEKFEPRSGGSWRYIHTDQEGHQYGFHGVYHEVREPSRMIDTFEFEGLPEAGHVSMEKATFEEIPGGKTRLTIHSVFDSVADRDGMMRSGMEEGLSDSFNRLDELLEKMKKGYEMVTPIMARLNAYLGFNGNCRQAMEFYKQCLGGQLDIMTVGESKMASLMPAEAQNNVMHSRLVTGNITFMASDMMGKETYQPCNNVSLCLICKSKSEIEMLFSKLSEGGKVTQPLQEVFFGTFGAINDKFGINWMFQFGESMM